MKIAYRTHTCNDLRKSDEGKIVELSGWIHSIRSHGNLVFVDIRDRYGRTQVTIDSDKFPDIKSLKKESVINIKGLVKVKPEPNKKLKTGEIEVKVNDLMVLSSADVLPMDMETSVNTNEETTLKYRYLDLRRQHIKENLLLRHKITNAFREFLTDEKFVEIETPILARSTPEGARDFLVPARLHPGKFFALPQSPQIFKQILMVSGMDRYFQLARCFRDEDLRADRQLEFTQVDIEMSFVDREDILDINERMMKHVMKKVHNIDIEVPFVRFSYDESMKKYGNDKPDLRFGLELEDLTEILKKSDFGVFQNAEYINGLKVKTDFSRKQIDALTKFVLENKGKGLIWFKFGDKLEGSAVKFLSEEVQKELVNKMRLTDGEILFVIADEKETAQIALGNLRSKLGKDLGLIQDGFKFCWVIDFPMFEWSEEFNRIQAMHHPFTSPNPEDISKLEDKPMEIRTNAYDLVLNGHEVAGGSIRIHDRELQSKIFKALGLSEEKAQEKFGFLLNAFKYGVPPHGGIAYGLDRFIMILAGAESIRDVIAFPRNKHGVNPMDNSPNTIDTEQLDELGLELK